MLDNCGMIDFPFKCNSLSWVGYRKNGKVQCRLDRAIGNGEWHHLFSHTNVEYLKLWGSDHRPILARILSKTTRVQRGFKFDKRWLDKDGLKETIVDSWDTSSTIELGKVSDKIISCRSALSRWKRTIQSNSIKKIEAIKAQLEQAQVDDNVTSEEVLNLKWNLCSAFREEE
ncbi:unnamed protein product [Microthlaspi erraticum]|uniref:Endonuclease/exonuclease/phosphatase domain-containing protein n=1 Tax=Microthlaspi erraticum TaxID=1685480 RepID=A0A6D2KAP1_9BRAS|nr:unnamed protein product [Microthlaspi erraticum]